MGTHKRKRGTPAAIAPRRQVGWGSVLSASPVAWIGLGVSLAIHAGTIGYIYSNLNNALANNAAAIVRNDARDVERETEIKKTLARLDANLGNMLSLRTDVEVVKSTLVTISAQLSTTLQRQEAAIERANQRIEALQNRDPPRR